MLNIAILISGGESPRKDAPNGVPFASTIDNATKAPEKKHIQVIMSGAMLECVVTAPSGVVGGCIIHTRVHESWTAANSVIRKPSAKFLGEQAMP